MTELKLEPFADDESVWSVDGLSVENGISEIVLHGSVTFARDRLSLRKATELATLLEGIVSSLAAEESLPEQAEHGVAPKVTMVANPFA